MNNSEILRLLTLAEEAARLARSLELPMAAYVADILVHECAEVVYLRMDAAEAEKVEPERSRPSFRSRQLHVIGEAVEAAAV